LWFLADTILPILGQLAFQLPLIAVFGVGVVLALTNRPRLGRAATFALVGFSILLIERVLGSAVAIFIPISMMRSGGSATQVGAIIGGLNIFNSFITAVAFGFLIAAIFARR
jgi:hypothetical protein